jgi:hypothetical protein
MLGPIAFGRIMTVYGSAAVFCARVPGIDLVCLEMIIRLAIIDPVLSPKQTVGSVVCEWHGD